MSFVYSKYAVFVIAFVIIYTIYHLKTEKSFFTWIYDNWFYKRSFFNFLSSIFFVIGIVFLSISLLDLRGAEQKVEGEVSNRKTIILIDSSLSMLAEDVRPSRYEKAIFIARHFIKNSAGHRISVVLFSDTHKKLVPFTMDRDLLDSRVSALSEIGVSGGGTGLKQAIQESIQYFGTEKEKNTGNIILITDAEETNEGFSLEVPENITVAVIGVGTANGGMIPLRDQRGVSSGFKTHEGKNVITKLDEEFLKKIGKDIKYYNYWIASSFSLPTNEILNFFNQSVEDRKTKDDVTIRPVLAEFLMIPGILALIMSCIFKFFRAYTPVMLVFILLLIPKNYSYSQESGKEKTPEDLKKEKEIDRYLSKWKNRDLSIGEKLDLANKYSQMKVDEKASILYKNVLEEKKLDESVKYDYFNWATTQLRQKDFSSSLGKLKNLKKYLQENPSPDNEKLLEDVRKNTLLALQQQKSSKNEEQQKKGGGESQDQKKKSKGDQNKEDKNKNGKKENEDEKDKEKDGNEKQDKKSEKNEGKDNKRKKKLPGLLKQLLNDDRKLQQQLLDTSTNKKENSGQRRDW